MLQHKSLLKSLRLIADLGIPLRRFIYPNLAMIVLEVLSLYLLARLLSGILSTASGAPIDVRGAIILAILLVIKSAMNAVLTRSIYRSYKENEIRLRRFCIELARMAPSRLLRSRSVETVTHEINVYPSNLTYGVYQQAVKLLSDTAITCAIVLALVVNNPSLTSIVLLLFIGIAYLVTGITIRKSSKAGRITDEMTIRLVNFLGRYLGGRNEITGSPIERMFQAEIDVTSGALSCARGDISYITLIPRFAFDAVCGIGIVVVVASVAAGWAHLDQKDLAFSLAAALKLAPYLTSIISGVLQISFSRAIVDGFNQSMATLTQVNSGMANGVAVRLRRENEKVSLELDAGGSTTVAVSGQILLIQGRSGSGKTTIAELIADVAEGRVLMGGGTSVQDGRHSVAYSSQFATVLNTSLLDNIVDKATDFDKVKELLLRYGLDHLHAEGDLNENTLSGGERQRIGIVRALSQNSDIAIFDEPTASIGVIYSEKIHRDVAELAARGTLVIVISHESTFDGIANCVLEL